MRYLVLALLGGLMLTASSSRAAEYHNLGSPPPPCTVPEVLQPNGQFPAGTFLPAGCLLPSNQAVAIKGTKVSEGPHGLLRLEVYVTLGSVTVGDQTYDVPSFKIPLLSTASGCKHWSGSDPLFECSVNMYETDPYDLTPPGGCTGQGTCQAFFFARNAIFPGRFWFRVTAWGYGATAHTYEGRASAIVDVPPAGTPPTAVIRPEQSAEDPFTFSFDGTGSVAQQAGTTLTDYDWDFGDQEKGSGPTVAHTFAKAGLYTVGLTVTDSNGATGQATYLADVSPVVVTLIAGVTNGKVFSVDAKVRNAGKVPLTNVAFVDPAGIVDTGVGDPGARGEITPTGAPAPNLPAVIAAGASATTTVVFRLDREGGVDLASVVTGVDDGGVTRTGSRHALVQIGKRRLTQAELEKLYSDTLTDSAQTVGALFNAAQSRLGLLAAWASGPAGGDTAPAWLRGSITEPTVVPPGTPLADPPWLNVSAGRALGMDDRAFSWVPDDTTYALLPFLTFADRFAYAGGKVIDESGNAVHRNLRYAAEFYGQLASGNQDFQGYASRGFNAMVKDLGSSAADGVALLGALIAFSHDDPLAGDLGTYEKSPVLQQFAQQSAAIIDAGLQASYDKIAHLVRVGKVDPAAGAGQLGDLLGGLVTSMARDIAVLEMGAAGVARLGTVIEDALPFARTGKSLDAGLAAADPAAAPLTASVDAHGEVVVRQALESLGDGAVLTTAQLEALGGFYAEDAARVQQIINEINAKYGVNIEIQVRPGNPASLQFYRDGTGVPKPEWVKPKNTEWMDLVLGAPPGSLGKATVFKPIKPTPETLAKFTEAQRYTILDRYGTQLKLYKDATEPGGKFFKLIADSQKPEGATVTVGFKGGQRDVTGLKYSLRPVGEAGQEAYVVIDEAAGGKFVLSDADYQAVVDANTGKHLPAGKRGQIELEVMNRFGNETVSFGGHGWSHSGFDLPSKYSEPFIKFVTESSSPAAARRTLEWFIERGDLPEWVHKIYIDLALKLGHPPTTADLVAALLELFRPGSFVVKFNGVDVRTGYAAGIR